MKNYMAFYGEVYYPTGGMGDFVDSFDSLDEAINSLNNQHNLHRPQGEFGDYDWGEVYSIKDREIIYSTYK